MLADGFSFFQALGFSLLNSVWIFGLAWALMHLFNDRGNPGAPITRYRLAIGLLSAGLLLTIATFVVGFQDPVILYLYALPETMPGIISLLIPGLPYVLPYLAFAYLLVLPLEGFRRLRHKGIYKLQGTGDPLEPMILSKIEELSGKLGISRKICFAFSTHIHSPLTYGFWKPVILFPVALASKLSLAQTEALLLHELAHIRNNDYLVHLVLQATETLFFFNPFVKKIIRTIALEQELRSDDLVTNLISDKIAYAEALYQLGAYNGDAQLPFAVKASGDEKWLLYRISRIAGRNLPARTKKTPAVQAMLGLASLLLCSLTLVPHQQPSYKTNALAGTPTSSSSPVRPTDQKLVQKLSIAANFKVKKRHTGRVATKRLSPSLNPENPVRFATLQSGAMKKDDQQPFIATGNLMEQRAYTLEESNISNGTEEKNTTEVRMEPYLPGNSFYYSKADQEVKLFLANYADWLRELRQALTIASLQNNSRMINYLTKRIRHIETRKLRLDALREAANKSDSSLKVVSF